MEVKPRFQKKRPFPVIRGVLSIEVADPKIM